MVEGERFPLNSVLAARTEYFRVRFKSGMQDGGTKKVCYEDVSFSAFRALLRFLYAGSSLRAWEGGVGGKGKAEDRERESLMQELLRVADLFQAGRLYAHCLAEFRRALTVETAIQQLVRAHAHAPEGAREVAMEYVTANFRAIQVG